MFNYKLNRKNYIDNLRIFCILLIFPYHTAMIFNNWGEAFYIQGEQSFAASLFMVCVYPWWMNLLFLLAGMSAYYSLSHRSIKDFVKERTDKLLIPFIAGMLTIIPVQTYVADLFHNNYSGGFLSHYAVFFTRITDLSGADGGLTPGHLWFVLYLYIISVVTVPIVIKNKDSEWLSKIDRLKYPGILSLFVVVLICLPILNIGKSIGEAMACFTIGLIVISRDEIQAKIEKGVWISGGIGAVLLAVHLYNWICGRSGGFIYNAVYQAYSWSMILFFLGLFMKFFNGNNEMTLYLRKASFPIYYIHQTILVVTGYVVLKLTDVTWQRFTLTCIVTTILTFICYELYRRVYTAMKSLL